MGTMRRRNRDGAVPAWTGGRGARPRVLLEHPDPAALRVLGDGLEEEGFEVLSCSGPHPEGGPRKECPLLHGQACPGLDGADVVVTSLRVEDDEQGRIVLALAGMPDGPPVLLEATSLQAEQRFQPDEGPTLTYPFADAHHLAAQIRGVLRDHAAAAG